MFLSHLKKYAQSWIDHKFNIHNDAKKQLIIKHCIISIPTYFDYKQRKCIMDSANIAGFESFQLLDQSVLCGINYVISNSDFQRKHVESKEHDNDDDEDESLIMIYNLGASTLNLSLILYNNKSNIIEVKGIEGDMNLGGNNIDHQLIHFCDHNLKDYMIQIVMNQTDH